MKELRRRHNRMILVAMGLAACLVLIVQVVLAQVVADNYRKDVQKLHGIASQKIVEVVSHALSASLEEGRKAGWTASETENHIKAQLKTFSYNDDFGENYLFLLRMDGTMLLSPADPDMENKNQLDKKDERGHAYIREIIQVAGDQPEGGTVTYQFIRLGKTATEEKVTYVRRIPGTDWIIGTGVYMGSGFLSLSMLLNQQRIITGSISLILTLLFVWYAGILLKRTRQSAMETARVTQLEENLRHVFDAQHDAVFIHATDDDRILRANARAGDVFALGERTWEGMRVSDISEKGRGAREEILSLFTQIRNEEDVLVFDWKCKRLDDGTLLDTEVALRRGRWDGEDVIIATVRDITERRKSLELQRQQLEELRDAQEKLQSQHDSLTRMYAELLKAEETARRSNEDTVAAQLELEYSTARYRLVAEGANDIIWDWDPVHGAFFISERFNALMGYEQGHAWGYDGWRGLIHPGDRPSYYEAYQDHFSGRQERCTAEFRMKMQDGVYKWFMSSGMLQMDEDGNVNRYAGTLTDITERRQQEEIIRALAYYDYLTELPNRPYFMMEMERRLLEYTTRNTGMVVLFMDLDNFKIINDAFGHNFGDKLLKLVAQKLDHICKEHENTFLARMSGDEFMILIQKSARLHEPDALVADILRGFEQPFAFDEKSLRLSVSIGMTCFPEDGQTVEALIKNTDTALHAAKGYGRTGLIRYDAEMGKAVSTRIDMETAIRNAVENKEFHLCYQPQWDVTRQRIAGFEALLRWVSPNYGNVSPAQFIPLAETSGLIVPVGRWVVRTAFEFAARINQARPSPLCVSINVSPLQFLQSDFVSFLQEQLLEFGLKADMIAIEITETSLMESFGMVAEKLASLRELGFRIYLDDFGTGYSSLNYLKSLPIDTVKIDKSFVDDIQMNETQMRLIQSIIAMSHNLGLHVVAEGVETRQQLDWLMESQCDAIQGYWFSRPLLESDAESLLQRVEDGRTERDVTPE